MQYNALSLGSEYNSHLTFLSGCAEQIDERQVSTKRQSTLHRLAGSLPVFPNFSIYAFYSTAFLSQIQRFSFSGLDRVAILKEIT